MELYRHIAHRTVLNVAVAADVADCSPEEAEEALDSLLRLDLLRRVGAELVTAVPPSESSIERIDVHEARLLEERRRLSLLRDQIMSLTAIHARADDGQAPPLEWITSIAAIRELLTHLAVTCKEEVLAAQPGGPRPESELAEASERDLDLLKRGIALRTLYQYSARFDPSTSQHAALLSSHGAQIRTITGGLMRLLVFDRETAVIPLGDASGGAVVIRDAAICKFMVQIFQLLWVRGEPIDQGHDRPFVQDLTDQTKQAIMSLLIEGADDRAAARALGISVRTCQRHVSDIMARVGAGSRLQLGYLIHQKNLVIG
ncbi:LuxR C-terminal-related transcriptional regulator [Streptomyces sp. NPDC056503]|uniref:LuxR C-terminal-related transcriptional regulator n=1 Tax=Streptomyces sp. NPDC056503 TaxID=3345842 RepID=UPI0036AAB9C2